MNPVIIDADKCIGCGLCVKDCVSFCLYLEDGKAHSKEKGCIGCGHCYAICPQNAVTLPDYEYEEEKAVSMAEIDSDTLLQAMKSRRTIRHFTDEPVEKEKIDQILEAGRYAPTGGNAQDVQFIILEDKKEEAEKICVDLFRSVKKKGEPFSSYLKGITIDDRFFFKGAPLVIIVTAKSKTNAGLASSYMELMAESLGLGVLYSGFFVVCTRLSRKLKKLLQLEKGQEIVTCMIIGYPAVKYQRIVPRNDAKIKTI